MTDALWGFIGAVLGAAAGLVGTLAGLRHTRKLQAEQWERETSEARLNQLKEAYVEYFSSFQRMHAQVTESLAMAHNKHKNSEAATQAGMALGRAWREQMPMMGTRVRLLEPNPEARERTGTILGVFSVALANAISGPDDFLTKVKTMNDVQDQVAKFELWIIEERFGAPKAIVTTGPSEKPSAASAPTPKP